MSSLDYVAIIRKYVAMARMEPDERFTDHEHEYLMLLLQGPQRRRAVQEWVPVAGQPITMRVRTFLLRNPGPWRRADLMEACRVEKYNSLVSALYRLHAAGHIAKISYNLWEATSVRGQAHRVDHEVRVQAAPRGARKAARTAQAA